MMVLKPGETCKYRKECSYAGFGVNECYGLRKDRDNYFRCPFVNEGGEFNSNIDILKET